MPLDELVDRVKSGLGKGVPACKAIGGDVDLALGLRVWQVVVVNQAVAVNSVNSSNPRNTAT